MIATASLVAGARHHMTIGLPFCRCTRFFVPIVLLLFAIQNAPTEGADTPILTIATRYSEVVVFKDKGDCCAGWIQFGTNKIKVGSAGTLYASNEGVFPMKEGDVVIISIPAGAKGVPPQYHVMLVNNNLFVDLSPEEFATEDWTFKVTRKGNELLFDLGFKDRKRKTAVYRNGVLYVGADVVGTPATVPKDRCASILNDVAECGRISRERIPSDCSQNSIQESLPMSITRNLFADANLPVFKEDNFYAVCASICETDKYDSRSARRLLCGY
jgi:hypothetical protein